MPYSTVQRFVTRYPRMSKTEVNSAGLYEWLVSASNYIDGYIGSAVATIPVTPAPPILQDLSEDLAFLMFLKRHIHESGKETGLEKAWNETLNRLENMRAGTFLIYSGSGTLISVTQRNAEPWSSVSQYTPTFGISDIDESIVDPDRVDAEEDAR